MTPKSQIIGMIPKQENDESKKKEVKFLNIASSGESSYE